MSVLRFFVVPQNLLVIMCEFGITFNIFWRFVETINRLIAFLTAVSSRTHPEGIPGITNTVSMGCKYLSIFRFCTNMQ